MAVVEPKIKAINPDTRHTVGPEVELGQTHFHFFDK